jgi:dTDP-4-dehydrorhamnose 3,5-epimerase
MQEVQDTQTVKATGERLDRLPAGVTLRDIPVHVDDRGMVFEMFDPRWNWTGEPLVYAYCYTLRPGMIKGWAVHREHEDRYCIVTGEVEVVLYDERLDSPTTGLVAKVYLSDQCRRLMNIPIGVWHASRNIGQTDAFLVNFPTKLYNHERPDKFRLPLNNDRIPHQFEAPRGW